MLLGRFLYAKKRVSKLLNVFRTKKGGFNSEIASYDVSTFLGSLTSTKVLAFLSKSSSETQQGLGSFGGYVWLM